jgi:hypothetical protein
MVEISHLCPTSANGLIEARQVIQTEQEFGFNLTQVWDEALQPRHQAMRHGACFKAVGVAAQDGGWDSQRTVFRMHQRQGMQMSRKIRPVGTVSLKSVRGRSEPDSEGVVRDSAVQSGQGTHHLKERLHAVDSGQA